ncbi:MAG: Ada metal-binding domain-containing protein [Chryseosolibacter sp.]
MAFVIFVRDSGKTVMLPGTIDAITFKRLVRARSICFGGNLRLRIYGKLTCASGKRMKKSNRVFFSSEAEALHFGFRPCAHCMRMEYAAWKKLSARNTG